MPASRVRCSSSPPARAVIATIGRCALAAFALADQPRQLKAVHAGQVQIQQQHVERTAAELGQRRQPVRHMRDPMPLLFQQAADHRGHGGVVLHQQHVAAATGRAPRRPALAATTLGRLRAAAGARGTCCRGPAATPARSSRSIRVTSSRQIASPRPLPARRCGPSSCSKRWNNRDWLASGMPGPVSITLNCTPLRVRFRTQRHAAALGELHRVVGQVEQDLLDPHRVADQPRRQVRRQLQRERNALGPAPAPPISCATSSQQLARLERGRLQLQPAGLDPGQVERVVEQLQQHRAGALHGMRVIALVRHAAAWSAAARPCRSRRSSACGSRGSAWPGTGSWPRWPARPAGAAARTAACGAAAPAVGARPAPTRPPAAPPARRRPAMPTSAPTVAPARGSSTARPDAPSDRQARRP